MMENKDGEKNDGETGWETAAWGEDIIKEGTGSTVLEWGCVAGERESLLAGFRFIDIFFIDRMALLIAETTESRPTAEFDNQVLRTVLRKGGARGHLL